MYKQIKWLILIIHSLTIWLWEYIRHEYLLPYISMGAGNWLSPLIVFLITLIFITRLFAILEKIQEELHQSRLLQTAVQERENLARDLHDGIAQSLFLMSVKLDHLKLSDGQEEQLQSIKKTVREVNEYVRQSITTLKQSPEIIVEPSHASIYKIINEMNLDPSMKIEYNMPINELNLSVKEQNGLFEFIREGIHNIQKHAVDANHIRIRLDSSDTGWKCFISDNGKGFIGNPFRKEGSYGLKFLKQRASELGWNVNLRRDSGRTTLEVWPIN
ncbi:histidine kinase [Paenibacillus sp. ATY16]|uniref:sensor histidine kinase n=1 Tax=Paenibacillus sp. ATY16 TaxID=1759312 RepID=UPI00200FBE9F|nr:histidine kinase [Paenibacillus sp. ATY16]MCK9859643.1 histidine kinase [Paenibacillus sp. ATY16]